MSPSTSDVGGCAGTHWGCCQDNKTVKKINMVPIVKKYNKQSK